MILKNIFQPDELEDNLKDFFDIGRLYFKEEKGLKYLENVIKYIYKKTEIKTATLSKTLETISEKAGRLAMTTAEKLREQGMQQGMQEGIIENSKENIIEVLELRFSKISPEIVDKINQINDSAKLKELLKKAIQIKEMDTASFFS